MDIGKLTFDPIQLADQRVPLVVSSRAYDSGISNRVFVAGIDPDFADTSSFCKQYDISESESVNCIVIEAKKAGEKQYCACLIMASDMIDVNGKVRKALGASKASFAAKDVALELTGMEYGGVTPVGLPDDWVIYVDESVMEREFIVIGGGYRASKIAAYTGALLKLPNAKMVDIKKEQGNV
jgi:prolyl-tRNA editing enzyme YbaK/EbsC (Cys-tRNA(Pro) deacylase)